MPRSTLKSRPPNFPPGRRGYTSTRFSSSSTLPPAEPGQAIPTLPPLSPSRCWSTGYAFPSASDRQNRRNAWPPILQSVGSGAPYSYILSLPERVLRSLGALSGGLLREIGNVALPASVRRTALYRTMVGVALRFLIEEVGQVEGVYPSEGRLAENFLLKRTASHGIELLGILAFQASPIWVLAALADAAGGSLKLIQEISQALQEEGLLDREARFETMEQVLDGLEKTTGHLADTLNLPPVDIRGLRREWGRLKDDLRTIPPRSLDRK